MNNRELLLRVLNHETGLGRAAWVPFAGVHAGSLLGYDANEVLKDSEKLVNALLKVNEVYKPDGQPVIFDLQLEAEALGCELYWDEGGKVPPTVKVHPYEFEKKIPCDCKMPTEKDGRFPIVLDAMRKIKEKVGNNTALYGLICGPFTLASHLRGQMLFMDMYDDIEYVQQLINFCKKVCIKVSEMYIEAGMDVIGYVDPLLSQISSDHIEEFLQRDYIELFEFLRNKNVKSSLFVCGDATRNLEALCKCKPDCLSIDENVDIKEAKEVCDRYNVVVGGNIQLTITMLHGTTQDNMKAVIDIISSCGTHDGIIISPGCDMPYDVPMENGIACYQAVTDFENVSKALENYTSEIDVSDIDVVVPDYNNLEKPLVEAFTLDSRTCAACTYTMNLVKEAYEKSQGLFDYVEYRFTEKENIARCKKMGVAHLPCIYINGKLEWSSLIPTVNEFIERINEIKK